MREGGNSPSSRWRGCFSAKRSFSFLSFLVGALSATLVFSAVFSILADTPSGYDTARSGDTRRTLRALSRLRDASVHGSNIVSSLMPSSPLCPRCAATSAPLREQFLIRNADDPLLRVTEYAYAPWATSGAPAPAAWHAGALDWHDLVPPRSAGRDFALADLVARELAVVDVLQNLQPTQGSTGGCAIRADCLNAVAATVPWAYSPVRGRGRAGPLAKYTACNSIRDVCLVHATVRACVSDEICGWCPTTRACVSRVGAARFRLELVAGERVRTCADQLLVSAASVAPPKRGQAWLALSPSVGEPRPVPAAQCTLRITRRSALTVRTQGTARMAYHFYTEVAPGLAGNWLAGGAAARLGAHVWLSPEVEADRPFFLSVLHTLSDSCPRGPSDVLWIPDSDAPPGAPPTVVCYLDGGPAPGTPVPQPASSPLPLDALDDETLDVAWENGTIADRSAWLEPVSTAVAAGMRLGLHEMAAAAGADDGGTEMLAAASDGSLPEIVAALLGLARVAPQGPLLTLVSRRNKRLILNEGELISQAVERGLPTRVALLEDLPLFEQVLLLRRSTVLAGMHGSALINSVYMAPGTALLQLLPYKVDAGGIFFRGAAEARGVAYYEWANSRVEDAVFHWHFLGADYPPARRESMLREGSQCCGEVAFFSFWINQDTRVDARAFGELLDKIAADTANAAKIAAAGGRRGDAIAISSPAAVAAAVHL